MESILFIIIIIFLIVIQNKLNTKFSKLENTIDRLNNTVYVLTQKLTSYQTLKKQEEVVSKPAQEESKEISKPIIAEKPKVAPPKKIIEVPKTPVFDTTSKPSYSIEEKKTTNTIVEKPKKVIPKKSLFEKFKEKHPDLEKFIGENLINKLGILILVLGISFFVKFAIDKDWINEPARVGIGFLCGALVMALAHKLKKDYASFSSVLVAGAISVFYFTIYIAFHEYELFSQTVAFSIMAVITAFSTLVSVSYNRQELAVLSLIGGFAAPFMVSIGEGNYVVLFSYIAILNLGILAVSYFKKWKTATIVDFAFTTLLFVGWCLTELYKDGFEHFGALTFATLFYFIFSITIVLNNLKNKGVFSKVEYFILIANTFIFFGIGMLILKDLDSNFTGLFTLLLAIYNLAYATILYKKFGLDKNAIYILIGLALTFVTLTIPIQFNGNQITLFWAAEAVLLLWLSQKSKISSFKFGAIIVQILAVISLLLDWKGYAYSAELSLVFNPLFIAGFIVSISLFLTYWLLRGENDLITKKFKIKVNSYKIIVLLAGIIVTYFTGILEIQYQANQFLANTASAISLPVGYHFVFVAVLLYLSSLFTNKAITKGILGISIISIFLYIIKFYGLPSMEIIENFVNDTNTHYAFILHYIVLGCLMYFGVQIFKKINILFNIKPKQSKWLPWLFVFAIVYVLSNEIMLHSLYFLNNIDLTEYYASLSDGDLLNKKYFVNQQIADLKLQIVKIGYPILWGVFSFIFLIIGIKKQWKVLRIIALSLLGITIIKLFAYDIKNVSETGKIIAFILLGVLILIISFVYQKIKKLVNDETSGDEKI